ncbi:MAG: hypothetical protein AAB417_01275 [Patescibacteria group bacterium]
MQGKRKQVVWFWRIGLVLAFIFAVTAVTRTAFVFFQARTAFRETGAVDDAIGKREQEIRELETRITKLKSGEGLEMEARGRLNLQKPDEAVVIIVEDEKKKEVTSDNADRPWWKNVLGWVGIAL